MDQFCISYPLGTLCTLSTNNKTKLKRNIGTEKVNKILRLRYLIVQLSVKTFLTHVILTDTNLDKGKLRKMDRCEDFVLKENNSFRLKAY